MSFFSRPFKKRHYVLFVLFFMLLAFSILLILRWGAWFGNYLEEPYKTSDSIDRITLTSGEDFLHERTVSWRCGEELKVQKLCYADLGVGLDSVSEQNLSWKTLEAKALLVETRSGKAVYYSASLSELEEGHTYLYRIEKDGAFSDSYRFTIPEGLDSLERFVYLGDVQDPDGKLSSKLFSNLLPDSIYSMEQSKSKSLIKDPIHFVATAGDQIEGPTDKFWSVWYKAWGRKTLAEIPFNVATGNHEYLKKGFLRELDPRWIVQYNFPQNGPKNFLGRSYYIDYPLMRFIVLDSNGIMPWAVFECRDWLKETLLSSKQKWQVVMFHHGVQSVREDRYNIIMNLGFKSILEDCGADLVLQGHDHAYSRISRKDEKGRECTPVYLISTSSPKLYRNGFDKIHDRLGSGMQLYQIIEVRPDMITYRAYQYDGSLYDSVNIYRSEDESLGHRVMDLSTGIEELFLFDVFSLSKKGQKKRQCYQDAVKERQILKRKRE